MVDTQRAERIIGRHGLTDFKWIDPKAIVVSQWVRMKCQFGCPHYGRIASCPPNTPTVDECRQFFLEYATAVVFRFQGIIADTAERHAWSAKTNVGLVSLERDIFLAGYPKAFVLFMDSCHICAECVPARADCKEATLSRPSPEGMAVDVFATAKKLGYPIEVLTDTSQPMNRYAFLMLE
jgi:predicted metal-binding protein